MGQHVGPDGPDTAADGRGRDRCRIAGDAAVRAGQLRRGGRRPARERGRRSSSSACSTRRATELCRSNPLRVVAKDAPLVHFWGDTHGQSNETLGTNDARAYFEFGRDKAFLDVMGHQGNDFQITGAFWRELNELSARVRQAGQLRVHPGLRVVGQHGGRRRPQRALPARGRDHPPLLARADRRCDRHRRRDIRRAYRAGAVREAQGQGLRGDGARRRALRRHQVRARPDGNGGGGAFGLGHVRVDRARCVREELSRRHRRQLGRAQGAAGRLLSGRVVLRQLRRAHLLPGRAAGSRRDLRVHAAAAALCDHGQPRAAGCDGDDGVAGRGVPARSGGGADAVGEGAAAADGRHRPRRR